jgi:hypothetical protein
MLCGQDMGDASRDVSSRTIWCLAFPRSEFYAFCESLVYAVARSLHALVPKQILVSQNPLADSLCSHMRG